MHPFVFEHVQVYLFLALFLLFCGIAGVIYRRTLIGMLVSMELILNGASLNLVAINRFVCPENPYGLAFALMIMGLAAAEAALALSIIILIYRKYHNIEGENLKELKG
jgi:NADH:ubiquinone oxidoreductase subunit K